MMPLDIRAFWLIGALASGTCGLLVLLVRRAYPDHLGNALALFGAANLCLSLNYLFRFERLWLGDFCFFVLGGTLVVACLSLELAAICLLKRRSVSLVWLFGPPVLTFGVCFWFTVAHRNASIQNIFCNAVDMILMAMVAAALFRREGVGPRVFVDSITGVGYSLLSLSTLFVVVDAIDAGTFPVDYNFSGPRSIFTNTAALLAQGIIFPLFLLMVSERLNRRLVEQAMLDPLTGIYNRRAFEEIAFRELSGTARSGESLSLLILDLDHFKEVNDRYGHSAGDALLRAAATTLRLSLRDEDFLCRWGGDEFCALLPRASRSQAEIAARRVLEAFQDFRFEHEGHRIEVSVSIGITSESSGSVTLSQLFLAADNALYLVKSGGRNAFAFAPRADEPSSV
jgi:diguanylate cyclase (GGDEF)-like protein